MWNKSTCGFGQDWTAKEGKKPEIRESFEVGLDPSTVQGGKQPTDQWPTARLFKVAVGLKGMAVLPSRPGGGGWDLPSHKLVDNRGLGLRVNQGTYPAKGSNKQCRCAKTRRSNLESWTYIRVIIACDNDKHVRSRGELE